MIENINQDIATDYEKVQILAFQFQFQLLDSLKKVLVSNINLLLMKLIYNKKNFVLLSFFAFAINASIPPTFPSSLIVAT